MKIKTRAITKQQREKKNAIQFFSRLVRTNRELLKTKDTKEQREYVSVLMNRLKKHEEEYHKTYFK